MKKIMLNVITIIVMIGFSGCSRNAPQIVLSQKTAHNKLIRNPEINKVATTEVGMNMYTKSNMHYSTKSILIPSDSVDVFGFGKKVASIMKNHEYKHYMWEAPFSHTIQLDNRHTCATDKGDTGYLTHYSSCYVWDTVFELDKKIPYEIIEKEFMTIKDDSFKYEALYQGKKGNIITISFMEFINNMARPAFTQTIDYELEKNKNTIVGFKGLRIEVIEATNMDITYKVIKDYN